MSDFTGEDAREGREPLDDDTTVLVWGKPDAIDDGMLAHHDEGKRPGKGQTLEIVVGSGVAEVVAPPALAPG